MPFEHRHRQRRRIARFYLIGLFFALRAADALLWIYVFDIINPWPFLRGQVAGSVLATTLLMFGMSQRQTWARYTFMVFVWYTVVVFSISLLVAIQEHQSVINRPIAAGFVGVIIYIATNVIVIRSRKIQALAHSGAIDG